MRLITNSEWREHTLPIFNRLKVLTVFDINKLQIVCFMYKAHHRQIPGYFNHFSQSTVTFILIILDSHLTYIYLIHIPISDS